MSQLYYTGPKCPTKTVTFDLLGVSTMPGFDPAAYIEQLRRDMDETLARAQSEIEDSSREQITGIGETGDEQQGRIRVILNANGGAEEVWIEPKAMRRGSEEVARLVAEAIRSASADIQAKIEDQGGPLGGLNDLVSKLGGDGPESVNATMRDMQQQIKTQMDKTVADMEERRRRLSDLGGGPRG